MYGPFIMKKMKEGIPMAGRKPKPTAVKKLEGNPGKRKLNTKEPIPAKADRAAVIALYLLYADNEPSAEVYGAAADRQQASIVFDVARQMVEMSQALMKRSKLMSATKRIVNCGNAGFYQVLSAEVGSKHGFSISGLVFEEIHTQPNRQLCKYEYTDEGVLQTSDGRTDYSCRAFGFSADGG